MCSIRALHAAIRAASCWRKDATCCCTRHSYLYLRIVLKGHVGHLVEADSLWFKSLNMLNHQWGELAGGGLSLTFAKAIKPRPAVPSTQKLQPQRHLHFHLSFSQPLKYGYGRCIGWKPGNSLASGARLCCTASLQSSRGFERRHSETWSVKGITRHPYHKFYHRHPRLNSLLQRRILSLSPCAARHQDLVVKRWLKTIYKQLKTVWNFMMSHPLFNKSWHHPPPKRYRVYKPSSCHSLRDSSSFRDSPSNWLTCVKRLVRCSASLGGRDVAACGLALCASLGSLPPL